MKFSENGHRVSEFLGLHSFDFAFGCDCALAGKGKCVQCAVEKIENNEESAMSVGTIAVHLQYRLYVVGHLSKSAFHFMFKSSVCSLWCRLLGLLITADRENTIHTSHVQNKPYKYSH